MLCRGVVTAFVLFVAIAVHRATSLASLSPPVVELACGAKVVGTWQQVDSRANNTQVRQFRGIPFAQPPVGSLRFTAPVDTLCPTDAGVLFNATAFSQPCIQSAGDSTEGSEDCLYLNVYVPECLSTSATQKAPVLVYIHGGSLTSGSGIWEPLQFLSAFAGGNDSASTADNSAVVVTINYRLGVLGFLAANSMCVDLSSGATSCGNFGIMDQVSALRWVRENIAAFGGDPTRVNLMGQSSGGTSIFALLAVPSSEGLFHSGISLSGSPNITMNLEQKLAQDAPLASALGCPNSMLAASQMECLRTIPANEVQLAMPNAWSTPALFSNRFLNNRSAAGEAYAGLAFVDGFFIKRPVWTSVAMGVHSNVTIVFGNMGQECNIGTPTVPVVNFSQSQWKSYLGATILSTWPDAEAQAERLYQLYANASAVNPQLAYDSFNADYGMSCATYSILKSLLSVIRRTRVAPLYSYMHQWGPQNPTSYAREYPDSMNYAFHTWDYVNGIHDWDPNYEVGEEDLALSRLQRAQWYSVWANKSIDASYGWPAVTEGLQPSLFLFSRNNRYPYRPTGATTDPYTAPGLCQFIVDELGMDQRYWWCN